MSATGLRQKFRLGSTLFSFTNEYLRRELDLEGLIARVAALELGPGLEMIGFSHVRGFPVVTDEFADRFRGWMAKYALTPTCLSINADVAIRRGTLMNDEQAAAYFEPQLRAAAKLGFPVVRTQLGAAPRVLEILLPLAEKLQVKMGPELHAPWALESPAVLAYREAYERLKSPFLGFIPDFGSAARALPPGYIDYLLANGMPRDLLAMAQEIWGGPGDAQEKRDEFNRRASALKADPTVISGLSVMFAILSPQDPRAWLAVMPRSPSPARPSSRFSSSACPATSRAVATTRDTRPADGPASWGESVTAQTCTMKGESAGASTSRLSSSSRRSREIDAPAISSDVAYSPMIARWTEMPAAVSSWCARR